jgi:hypothetical protein
MPIKPDVDRAGMGVDAGLDAIAEWPSTTCWVRAAEQTR